MSKRELYEEFIDRLEEADKQSFHLEACWLAYSIFEDRTASIVASLNLTPARHNLASKTAAIRRYAQTKPAVAFYLNDDQAAQANASGRLNIKNLNELDSWRSGRNGLVHSMANGSRTLNQINMDAQTLSNDSVALVRRFATVAQRIKKHKNKL